MVRHLVVLVLYLALTVTLTWPLALRAASAIPNDLGDPLLSTWTLWWNTSVPPLTERWWNGAIFFPGQDALTLSDHRLGISLITSPVIWAGGSLVLAYNLAFFASFTLSAAAAYAFCFVLTRQHAAAFLGGLIFGFNPFRAGHLSHLELLCSYSLPVALLALHRWHDTRRAQWLVLLTTALTVQALTSVYYFAFFAAVLALWFLWFVRGRAPVRQQVALGVSVTTPLLLIAPLLLRYRRAHASMGLARTIEDIEMFSADVRGLLTSADALALWRSPDGWNRIEVALYPGIVAVLIVAAGAWRAHSPAAASSSVLRRVRRAVLAVAIVAAAVAAIPAIFGPVATEAAGFRISVSQSYKPLSIALLFLGAWLLTTARVRAAWRTRSSFAFYTLATVAMWLFALGPTGHVAGERFLYKAPYAWLMLLPGVETAFRVPARFGMLAALTLCAAAALAWGRFARPFASHSLAATAIVAAAIAADSWIKPLALLPPPGIIPLPAGTPGDAVVLELPLGPYEDAAAMYRATRHGRTIVNGLSGYAPPHYQVLHSALAEDRVETVLALAERAPVLVVLNRGAAGEHLTTRVRNMPGAADVYRGQTHDMALIPRMPAQRHSDPPASTVTMQRGSASLDEADLPLLSDGRLDTGWMTPTQEGREQFVADLGAAMDVRGIVLRQGAWPGGFPRALSVRTSVDGANWEEVWQGDVAVLALRAAIANQRDVPIVVSFAVRGARYVQVRQVGWSSVSWAVAEFRAIVE
jgi:hypothetical protein